MGSTLHTHRPSSVSKSFLDLEQNANALFKYFGCSTTEAALSDVLFSVEAVNEDDDNNNNDAILDAIAILEDNSYSYSSTVLS